MKAQVAQINLGFTTFDGLMMPNGDYAIAVPQIADLFGMHRNTASRDLKRLMKGNLNSFQLATDFNVKAVNALTLEDFKSLLLSLALGGDPKAKAILGIEIPAKKYSLKPIERSIQLSLQEKMGGTIEVDCLAGKIDLLTATEIIEVKLVKNWKAALGQILIYGNYYPSHQKRIHLFGETQLSYLEMIRGHYSQFNVLLSHQTR